jgi:3-oxoacyl-[acyl-carrier protein] reductase
VPERVALVTGGARGIGRAISVRLAAAGQVVAVNYLTQEGAAKETVNLIEEAGGRGIYVQADVGSHADAERMFAEVEETLGPIEILVNNAGTRVDSLAMTMTDEQWDQVLTTNLYGTFGCTRRALRAMIKARWGRIINVTSTIALRGNPGQVNYAAAKAGQIGLTKTLAREVASRGITVNAVAPGLIPTELTTNMGDDQWAKLEKEIPMGRAGKPEEVAALVNFLASDEASYISGGVFTVDGAMTA